MTGHVDPSPSAFVSATCCRFRNEILAPLVPAHVAYVFYRAPPPRSIRGLAREWRSKSYRACFAENPIDSV